MIRQKGDGSGLASAAFDVIAGWRPVVGKSPGLDSQETRFGSRLHH